MDATICGGCGFRVEPVGEFEKDRDGKRWWLITRCPRERCRFNIDLELYERPIGDRKNARNERRNFWKGDHWE